MVTKKTFVKGFGVIAIAAHYCCRVAQAVPSAHARKVPASAPWVAQPPAA
jgi:hypothetical protein